jgi:signal transduction histidine kinase
MRIRPELSLMPAPRRNLRPISRARIEVVISRSVALFGLLFGAQALPVVLAQQAALEPWWSNSAIVACYGLLALNLVASVVKRLVRVVSALIAISFLAYLLLWAPAVIGGEWLVAERPWLWFLMTVATVTAAVAFPTWLATAYLFIVALSYGVLRVTIYGGGADPGLAALDAVYAILLGGAALVIITMLRAAAASVDEAQATALGRYLHVVREHATEVERVHVDAIVHDTVLSTFLTAARAETPGERELATTLARNAIRHLRDAEAAGPVDDSAVGIDTVVERIHKVQATMLAGFDIDSDAVGEAVVPASVAEALFSATLQAMVNSIQHAGDAERVRRWVTVSEHSGGVRIEIGDTGIGFDPETIPSGRLGVKVSIIERMIGAGGSATITPFPSGGSVVTLDWPKELP